MKRIIFSVFSQLPIHERVTGYSSIQFEKYYHDLYDSKKSYADACNADFMLVKSSEKNYIDLQHEKIIHLENFIESYDEILYLDFDVIPMTNKIFFDEFDLDSICILNENTNVIIQKEIENYQITEWKEDFKKSIDNYKQFVTQKLHRDQYHRCSKAFMKRQMLFNDDIITYDEHIVNTGIIAGNKKSISLLKYNDRLEEMRDLCDVDNNEIFFSYLLERYNIPFTNIGYDWHRVYDNLDMNLDKCNMLHVINKRFEDVYD